MFQFMKKTSMPSPDRALPGRPEPLPTAEMHAVFGRDLGADYPAGFQQAVFGMGCFWGAERKFWEMGPDKVWITAVGYAAGYTPNPTYEEVCSGQTGHNEVVLVIYDPELVRALGPEQRIALLEEESYLNMVQMLAAAVDAHLVDLPLRAHVLAQRKHDARSVERDLGAAHRRVRTVGEVGQGAVRIEAEQVRQRFSAQHRLDGSILHRDHARPRQVVVVAGHRPAEGAAGSGRAVLLAVHRQ